MSRTSSLKSTICLKVIFPKKYFRVLPGLKYTYMFQKVIACAHYCYLSLTKKLKRKLENYAEKRVCTDFGLSEAKGV